MATITLESFLDAIDQIKSADVDDIMNEMRETLSNYDLPLDQYCTACRETELVEKEVISIISDVTPEDFTSKIEGVFKSFREFMKNVWLDSVRHTASETTMAHFKYTIEKAKETANEVYNYYMEIA